MTAYGLALRNLRHQRTRTVISLAGIGFAVVLMFMQLGFLASVERTATMLYDRLDFDLVLIPSEYLDVNRPGSFPRRRLSQVSAVNGVASVRPLWIRMGFWRDPRPNVEARRWNILMLGVRPDELPLVFRNADHGIFRNAEEVEAARINLTRKDVVLIDRRSRPEFGSREELHPGAIMEVNERRVEIGGDCEIGTGFGANGLLLTSQATINQLTHMSPERVTLGLVMAAPGVDPKELKPALQALLPDALVYTRPEINEREKNFWMQTTAVGQFFKLGVIVALIVGVIFVYQMIAADIRNHIAEYATCKAIGYRNGFLFQVVLWQANLLALIGFFPGFVASLGIYEVTRQAARLPIGMTGPRAVLVLVLTFLMCLCSGALALRKLRTADPADLF